MIGEEKARLICQKVLSFSKADQTEVLLIGYNRQLTRFANSYIHQNVYESDVQLRVRVIIGKRVGVAVTNRLDDLSINQVVDNAMAIARLQPENPNFKSLPRPAPVPEVKVFDDKVASLSPSDKAETVGKICRRARELGLVASGAYSSETFEVAVANSLGIFAYSPGTELSFSTVIMSDTGSGYAAGIGWQLESLDPEALGEEAMQKALKSRNPREIPPGIYPVILQEYAVADMIATLAYLGMGALAVQEGRSFMCDNFGKQIMSPLISIWDDGLDPSGLPRPFDFEGVPKQKVIIIEKGVAKNVVFDSYTAGIEGRDSTGHALPAPNTMGPLPINLFMASGSSSLEEMLSSLDKGLLITRFHYTVPVDPKRTVVTGMTRDGTFWVEKGEVAYPVKNLRFTQNYVKAFAAAEAVASYARLVPTDMGGVRAPAIKIAEFEFTGVTEF
ncbi:MAG: TldD/PmbA family protein [Anaerolineae bacterium]|nr:TldD/PmbA family protein [Anaerolineae bacterium]MDW8101735.1 TldD/PmbA family protein [Anaerolineae bacterium]